MDADERGNHDQKTLTKKKGKRACACRSIGNRRLRFRLLRLPASSSQPGSLKITLIKKYFICVNVHMQGYRYMYACVHAYVSTHTYMCDP